VPCSALLPLHEGLIVTTDREDALTLEDEVGHELGVSTEGSGLSSLPDGVAEEADIAPVISSSDEITFRVSSDAVDVSAIGTSGEDTITVPAELDGLGCPRDSGGVRCTARVLLHLSVFTNVPEEEFVGQAGGSKELAIGRPIHGLDGRRVLLSRAHHCPGSGVVHADVVVVRTNSEPFAVGTDFHDLDPLLSFFELATGTVGLMDVDDTIVSSNDGLSVRSNGTGTSTLRGRQVSNGTSTSLLGFGRALRHLMDLLHLASFNIPDHATVIVAGGHDRVSIRALGKTPDFSIVVRVHDNVHVTSGTDASDVTITSSDHQFAVRPDSDSTDETLHVDASGGSSLATVKVVSVPLHDIAVSTSREDTFSSIVKSHGVNSTLVGGNMVDKFVFVPHEDATVSRSSVEEASRS